MAYQESELLEAESWGLVNVVHQAARCGHHNISQATVTIYSTNQKDSKKGNASEGHLQQTSHVKHQPHPSQRTPAGLGKDLLKSHHPAHLRLLDKALLLLGQ